MSTIRLFTSWVVVIVAAVALAACAGVEPELDDENGDAGGLDIGEPDVDAGPQPEPDAPSDTDADLDTDPEPPDTNGDGGEYDPCDDCASHEVCTGVECIDPCADQGQECGTLDFEGDQIECGDCPAGNCDDGKCPDLCDDFHAECGEVYWNGQAHDCGQCSSPPRCMHNRCTAGSGFIDIAAGHAHTCGLRPGGEVRCWGRNEAGQLGDQSFADATEPQWVHQINNAAALATFGHHSCVARDDDHIYCWGRNTAGELGDGTTDDTATPVHATTAPGATVATGSSHTCALLQNEKMLCWGANYWGQLGNGDSGSEIDHAKVRVEQHLPNVELDEVAAMSLGSGHSCAMRRDNTLWCWGQNQGGQLGLGDTSTGHTLAKHVSGLEPIHTVSAGFVHTCAIVVGGDLMCWGRGEDGKLGNGNATDHYAPGDVDLSAPVIDVATGESHTCAAVDSGEVYCWGNNEHGQLGRPESQAQIDVPMIVDGISNIHRVVAGANHSCALDTGGVAYCWGKNDRGQLGDSTKTDRDSPVVVGE